MTFHNFNQLEEAFNGLKRRKKLHPVTESRLAELLQDIYPEGFSKPETGEIPGGRPDLCFYFGDGHYVTFEVFATKSQVPQDLRHLEQSDAQVRIAILVDRNLDNGMVYNEYFSKKPRDPFHCINLSDILVIENESETKKKLKAYIDKALLLFEGQSVKLPVLNLRLYEMGRDQSKHEEISFITQYTFPQNYKFGVSLENTTEATLAKGISIRIQFSWRGNDLTGKGPSFEAPHYNGWKTEVGNLVCEQPAILTFLDRDQPCFHGQPIDWGNFRFTIFEQMKGYIEVEYNVSSIEPSTYNSGKLRIILG